VSNSWPQAGQFQEENSTPYMMDKKFFRGARLSTIIPEDSSRNISEIIEEQDEDGDGVGDGNELLPLRKQRDMLFFGTMSPSVIRTGLTHS
jgi:hypothetical protein